MWVRGILAGDYDVDLPSMTWVTFEEPHVAEYRDPPNVERAPAGKELKQMLLDGEVDAAILGDVAEQGPLKHLFPDHAAAARRWASAHGGVPINHMAVIRSEIAGSRPDVVREVLPPSPREPRRCGAPCGGGRIRCGLASTPLANRWNRRSPIPSTGSHHAAADRGRSVCRRRAHPSVSRRSD
jgi:4,5-dihydroxyphthalate decarboxylase